MSVCSIIGLSYAFLADQTKTVSNTFTLGDVNITLTESSNLDLRLEPCVDIFKDPVITVKEGSVDCTVFIKIDETDNLDEFVDYTVNSSWRALGSAYPNVYFQEVNNITKDIPLEILTDNKVTATDFSMEQMGAAKANNNMPVLSFTGYAIQKGSIYDETITIEQNAINAWTKLCEVVQV